MEFILTKQTEVAIQQYMQYFNQSGYFSLVLLGIFFVHVLIFCQLSLQLHSYFIICIPSYIANHSWIAVFSCFNFTICCLSLLWHAQFLPSLKALLIQNQFSPLCLQYLTLSFELLLLLLFQGFVSLSFVFNFVM